MPLPIEAYALIGNTRTAALVGNDGSIDWLCLPRFDSQACFAALLGESGNGRWLIAHQGAVLRTQRRYREGTLILETDFETDTGAVRVIDCMPIGRDHCGSVLRVVQGLSGEVAMRMELVIRFEYGSVIPWVQRSGKKLSATAGPDALELRTPVHTRGEDMTTRANFDVRQGESLPFVLTYYPSHQSAPRGFAAQAMLEATQKWWTRWSAQCTHVGSWREPVLRSLITLKALTYEPTGGIVAAPTTSLPEQLGGVRNWDYRYCWLRDVAFTLYALLYAGYRDEAKAWREWLLRAVAGRPQDLQILYGISGERRLPESEIPWLTGYEGAAPVRIGNAASSQYQLDVYGEVLDTFHLTRAAGVATQSRAWEVHKVLLDFLESNWERPDEGIWEVRGPRRHFTHSKVMVWVAFDRAVKAVERFSLSGEIERWRALRAEVHAQVCRDGFDADRNTFVQHYGSKNLDASLLMIPMVGFLSAEDPRMRGTVEAIRSELAVDGLIRRYSTTEGIDGLPPGEGAFLPCSFWLADNLALAGRHGEATALFERLLSLCNDVGLISEGYDTERRRLVGNFPQAMTHVALINTARNLSLPRAPQDRRAQRRP
ncbi:MAG: glucoamylase [Betaproteobacteria bacterium RIFCSPLOWO2_12_FULL_63_13]|nr:MAG: glucoamylase [Betaproteobacteria bacterium RIFCSPLOWO2_12_FULL_63_13]